MFTYVQVLGFCAMFALPVFALGMVMGEECGEPQNGGGGGHG